MNFDEALDDIFSSYLSVKDRIEGMHDSETRNPWIIIDIAKQLGLIPHKDKVIRVTGSKGKGTTSRIMSAYLSKLYPQKKIGLLVSPEELDHNDRIRVNNNPISKERFVREYREVKTILDEKKKTLSGLQYLSPSGTFLLIGLKVFLDEGCDFIILEGGRGVLYDEVGQITSKLSIVSSVFLEHPSYIGPTTVDIAKNKLSIGLNSDFICLGSSAQKWNKELEIIPEGKIVSVSNSVYKHRFKFVPDWYNKNEDVVVSALEFLDPEFSKIKYSLDGLESGSFGFSRAGNKTFIYDAIIGVESLDVDFYKKITSENKNVAIVLSLPDEKPVNEIVYEFNKLGQIPFHITLEFNKALFSYKKTKTLHSEFIIAEISKKNESQVLELIKRNKFFSDSDVIVFAGTQSYIRLIKKQIIGL